MNSIKEEVQIRHSVEETEKFEVKVSGGHDKPQGKSMKKSYAPLIIFFVVTIIFVIIALIWSVYASDPEVWRKWRINPVFVSLCWIMIFIVAVILLGLLGQRGMNGLAWVVLIIAIFLPIVIWLLAAFSGCDRERKPDECCDESIPSLSSSSSVSSSRTSSC